MALRKKLYYEVRVFGAVSDTSAAGVEVEGALGGAGTILSIASAAIRFIGDQSIVNFGVGAGAFGSAAAGSDADLYGNVMDPTLFDGVNPANDLSEQMQTRQMVGAWFQLATSDIQDPQMLVDFISQTATPIAGAGPIIPTAARRPRIRLRPLVPPQVNPPNPPQEYSGMLYVQRQHSLEV